MRAIVDGDDLERIIHMRTLTLDSEELLVSGELSAFGRRPSRADDVGAGPSTLPRGAFRARCRSSNLFYIEPNIYPLRPSKAGAGRTRVSGLTNPSGPTLVGVFVYRVISTLRHPVPRVTPGQLWMGATPPHPPYLLSDEGRTSLR